MYDSKNSIQKKICNLGGEGDNRFESLLFLLSGFLSFFHWIGYITRANKKTNQ